MIVVDSTVWADWFNDRSTPEISRLNAALEDEDVGVTPVIVAEVLQGFRHDRDFDLAGELLTQLPILTLDVEGHVAAARLFRLLRRHGVTIHGTIDCLIAYTCIAADVELLSTDQDFVAIARHCRLRLCAV